MCFISLINLKMYFKERVKRIPRILYYQGTLTSTLMAQRPMARTAFRTKSTSTSVAYSFSSANTWVPDRGDGVGGIWQGAVPEHPWAWGAHRHEPDGILPPVQGVSPEGGRELSGAPRGNQEG